MKKLMIISADDHASPRPSDYANLLEEKYRDRVGDLLKETDLFVENIWPIAKDQPTRMIVDPMGEAVSACKEALWDPSRRLTELNREGVAAEIIFPGDPASIGLYFSNMNEPISAEYRAAGVRAYNRWLADFCSRAPGRFFGIAQTEPWPDISECLREIALAKQSGMVAIALPPFPGIEPNQPSLVDPVWEPFWAACADHDLTISVHLGHLTPQGGLLTKMAEMRTRESGHPDECGDGTIAYDPAWRPLWQMIMAGVFDRYPSLRVTFSEIRTEWIAPTLANLEARLEKMRFDRQASFMPKRSATEYWLQNCGVAHMLKPYQLKLRHQIGVQNLMFSVDFPHIEGTWPNTREWLRIVMKDVPEHEVRLMLGENAARLYNIDTSALEGIVDQIALDPGEVLGAHSVPQAFIDSFQYRSIFLSRPTHYNTREITSIIDEDQAAILHFANQ